MSTNPAGDLNNAETFDVDAWIDDYVRPETVVELYPFEAEYAAKVAAIEAQIPAAEANTDRGMNDPTPETLWAQINELKAEREARVMRVRVRQITDADSVRAAFAAKKAKADESDTFMYHLSAATVAPDYTGPVTAKNVPPHFTAAQLIRLRDRDRSGMGMVAALWAAANSLMAGPPVPSSPER